MIYLNCAEPSGCIQFSLIGVIIAYLVVMFINIFAIVVWRGDSIYERKTSRRKLIAFILTGPFGLIALAAWGIYRMTRYAITGE